MKDEKLLEISAKGDTTFEIPLTLIQVKMSCQFVSRPDEEKT